MGIDSMQCQMATASHLSTLHPIQGPAPKCSQALVPLLRNVTLEAADLGNVEMHVYA